MTCGRKTAEIDQISAELDALENELDRIYPILEEDDMDKELTDDEIQREITEKYASYILDQQLRVIADSKRNQKYLN